MRPNNQMVERESGERTSSSSSNAVACTCTTFLSQGDVGGAPFLSTIVWGKPQSLFVPDLAHLSLHVLPFFTHS